MILSLDPIGILTLFVLGLAALTALALILADQERLPRLVLEGAEQILGPVRVRELLTIQSAWERKMLSATQLLALRILGGLAGLGVLLVLIIMRQPAIIAIGLGLTTMLLGFAYPGSRFQAGLDRRQLREAEEFVPGLVLFLRQEHALGTPVETALGQYIHTQSNALAGIFSGLPTGVGADTIGGVVTIAKKTKSDLLLQVAASLRALRRARDAEVVLENMELRARMMVAARIEKENAARRLSTLAATVSIMLISLMLMLAVPIILRVLNFQG